MAGARRAGRPTTPPKEGEKATLGIRASADLKRKLNAAANVNGRSLSQEAEFRLETSFRDADNLDQAMVLAYGPRLAVLLAAIGRAMNETGRLAKFPTDWMSVPALFNEAVGAADEVVESFRPADDGDAAARDSPLRGIAIGRAVARAIHDPNSIELLREWGTSRQSQIGADAAARLNVAPWNVAVSSENIIRTDRFTMRRTRPGGITPPRRRASRARVKSR